MSGDGLPMLPWFPRDFLASTLGWRMIERELYRALLDAQWDMGSLPADPAELTEVARARPAEFKSAWPRVRRKFLTDESGRLYNKRLEEHRHTALALRDKHSNAGRIGGLASAAARAAKQPTIVESTVEQSFNDRSTIEQANGQAESKPPSPSPSPSPSVPESPGDISPNSDTSSGAQKPSRAGDAGRKAAVEQRGKRCPEPFLLTTEMREWARVEAPNVDLHKATAEFVDYWRAIPGARGRKIDWVSTWRNRVRECEARAKLNGAGRQSTPALTKYDRMKAMLDDG
jgi:uncharacterized protein YdaU (DUF1376 family)